MKVVAKSRWFSILQATAHDEIITCADEVLIIAVDSQGAFLFVEEPAWAFDDDRLFLPGGIVETGEEVLKAAQRELREESGFAAESLTLVGSLRPWSKYLQVTSHVVRAQHLSNSPLKPDEHHTITLHRKSAEEVRAMVASGQINDARVVAALSLAMWQT